MQDAQKTIDTIMGQYDVVAQDLAKFEPDYLAPDVAVFLSRNARFASSTASLSFFSSERAGPASAAWTRSI